MEEIVIDRELKKKVNEIDKNLFPTGFFSLNLGYLWQKGSLKNK
jgi:hypothetical protein